MEYKKIVKPGYNLHIIKTDKFKTVKVQIDFRNMAIKEHITKRIFLNQLLHRNNAVYKTARDVSLAAEELYILNHHSETYLKAKHTVFSFSNTFINDQFSEVGMNEKAVQFLLDMIFKPNIIDNKFSQKEMDIIHNMIEKDILSLKDNPGQYAYTKMLEIMDPNGPLSYRSDGYLEDLKEINAENIYQYYLDFIKTDVVDIFICGDINCDKIIDMFDASFANHKNDLVLDDVYLTHDNFYNVKIEKETKVASQSKLCIGYKIETLTDYERRYVLPVFSNVFGEGPDAKLFKVVREKHSLCYTIRSNASRHRNILMVSAGISAKNYDKATELINAEFKNFKEGNISEQDLQAAKRYLVNSYKDMLDNKSEIIRIYEDIALYHGLSLEEDIANIEKVNIKEIIELLNKIHLDTVFLLEGVGQDA